MVSTRAGIQRHMEIWRKTHSHLLGEEGKVMDKQAFRMGLKEWVKFPQPILEVG